MLKQKETIVALATPPGIGSIGVIRLSGINAYEIGCKLTQTHLKTRHAHYLKFYDNDNQVIDQGIAIFFKAPHSFTGEDIVELQGHGGPVVMNLLIKAALNYGALLAKPGEFTERAFLNDKLDLAQAEAIADLIAASSENAAKSALRSLEGVFSQQINKLVDQLIYLRSYVESAIDFPDEEIDFLSDGKIESQLSVLKNQVNHILDISRQGAILNEGMTVVIAGKPNAGKSSLLNALSGKDSAIVTDIAGTTRDVLKEYIHVNGLPLHIIDTAGIRDSYDLIEQEGIKRALTAIEEADCILLVSDINEIADPSSKPQAITNLSKLTTLPTNIPTINVYNKVDLLKQPPTDSNNSIHISAKTGHGIEQLKNKLLEIIGFKSTNESLFTARERHINALESAKDHLNTGFEQLTIYHSGELLAEELKLAQNQLSSITGAYTADDLLGEIFSSFCIGK
ncbi:tRNA uridine-5-carboxymethylaminomethyl(34) synthesis GTPase MnmE [Thiotrichales bacterium 19S3-7]|nr:tRNA uridine-5-carboxymethylaminomethyl(34) synthesis GTPase MnmE [Thiotrichales bacterium 19S3-7]MCF6800843.1 tRNA uridine-5-carboxymethylaminomethyl(34) synthesis GTPase MnmE [Thiotrichales bacterium 19S3-11]